VGRLVHDLPAGGVISRRKEKRDQEQAEFQIYLALNMQFM
jgi:hypothetical protein